MNNLDNKSKSELIKMVIDLQENVEWLNDKVDFQDLWIDLQDEELQKLRQVIITKTI